MSIISRRDSLRACKRPETQRDDRCWRLKHIFCIRYIFYIFGVPVLVIDPFVGKNPVNPLIMGKP